jgi:hypothetical protein
MVLFIVVVGLGSSSRAGSVPTIHSRAWASTEALAALAVHRLPPRNRACRSPRWGNLTHRAAADSPAVIESPLAHRSAPVSSSSSLPSATPRYLRDPVRELEHHRRDAAAIVEDEARLRAAERRQQVDPV